MGIQNYYGIANNVCKNLSNIQRQVSAVIKNRLTVANRGEFNNSYLAKRYGKSKQVRWIEGIPIVPIGYCKSKNPMDKKKSINQYTPEGRAKMHKSPNTELMQITHYIMENPVIGRSIEYNDNRVSLYMGQQGKCAVTAQMLEIGSMHCHIRYRSNQAARTNTRTLYLLRKQYTSLFMRQTLILYLSI